MKISINDKEYGLQWGMGAVELYCDKMDCDIDGLDKITTQGRDQPKAIVTIVLSALQNYAELHDQDMPITYRQLQAHLDETPQEKFKAIMEDFKQSKYFGKTIAEYLLGEKPSETVSKKKSRSVK